MQQEYVETGDDGRRRQEPHLGPLRCPRCHSTDTKFRYYNNNDRAQPRHYCKTCRRYWTDGGSMRNIPFGGNRRSSHDKPAKDSSSSSHGSLSAPIPPATSYDPNDEISCLAAIQALTQPAPAHHVGNQYFDGGMNILQDRTFQSNYMAALNQTALPQPQLPGYGGNYPNWPMMNPTLPDQDFNNNFNFSAANAGFRSNSGGNTDDPETARTSMDSNDWPHFPSNYGGPP